MSGRDELAHLLFVTDNSSARDVEAEWRAAGGQQLAYIYDMADALIAAGYRKPRTVATVEELSVLPAMTPLYSTKTNNSWFWLPKNAPALVAWGTGGGYTYETDFIKFEAPLTVLHEGSTP